MIKRISYGIYLEKQPSRAKFKFIPDMTIDH